MFSTFVLLIGAEKVSFSHVLFLPTVAHQPVYIDLYTNLNQGSCKDGCNVGFNEDIRCAGGNIEVSEDAHELERQGLISIYEVRSPALKDNMGIQCILNHLRQKQNTNTINA